MNLDPAVCIDKKRARAAFDRAAASYDEHAAVERAVADHLLECLDVISLKPAVFLDLGTATGYCAAALEERYRRADALLLDLSPSMLTEARTGAPRWRSRRRYVCADIEALPIRDGAIDLIFSSSAFQWCNDLDQVLMECRRVIKPGGLIMFSSFGPDTLKELRDAWRTVDESPRVNQFIDMHDIGDALIRAGFSSPLLECERLTARYADAHALMRDLRGTGAVNVLRGRRRGLSTARELQRVTTAYEAHRHDGALPATYEVVYAHAWCPSTGERAQDGSTVATFPFADLKRRP